MQSLPTLVIRAKEVAAAIEVNGAVMGDVSPAAHLALPLSDTGDYYIGVYPLCDGPERYYPVIRKLRFEGGRLQAPFCGDVEAYRWPGGLVEAVFSPGLLPREEAPVFPYTVDRHRLEDGSVATLYYESGLRLAIERGDKVLYGTVLGAYRKGAILPQESGLLAVVAGTPNLPAEDCPDGYGRLLLVLDGAHTELLRIRGDAVGYEGGCATAFIRLPTELGHDRRQRYRYEGGAFFEEEPAYGFFTHAPAQPRPGRGMIRAFCDAARHALWEEAFSYLTPALREGLDASVVQELLGDFTGCREPVEGKDRAIGLLYPQEGGVTEVRVFSFSFEDGLIDNLAEE